MLDVRGGCRKHQVGREDQTAITASTLTLLAGTYDGSAANTGINVYVDGAVLDDADDSTGTYVAMENGATVTNIGATLSAASGPVAEEFWAGDMGFIALTAKELSIEDIWAIKALVNSYFDLSL